MRVWLGGEEITHLVTNVSIDNIYDSTAEGTERHLVLDLLPEVHPGTVIDYGFRPGSYVYVEHHPPQPDHAFFQDPSELPAKLCRQCGMWPEHHNHYHSACHCQECMPDAGSLPPDELGSACDDYRPAGWLPRSSSEEGAHP
jgi:hypothetical protein